MGLMQKNMMDADDINSSSNKSSQQVGSEVVVQQSEKNRILVYSMEEVGVVGELNRGSEVQVSNRIGGGTVQEVEVKRFEANAGV